MAAAAGNIYSCYASVTERGFWAQVDWTFGVSKLSFCGAKLTQTAQTCSAAADELGSDRAPGRRQRLAGEHIFDHLVSVRRWRTGAGWFGDELRSGPLPLRELPQ
jgi:hypothetical protein